MCSPFRAHIFPESQKMRDFRGPRRGGDPENHQIHKNTQIKTTINKAMFLGKKDTHKFQSQSPATFGKHTTPAAAAPNHKGFTKSNSLCFFPNQACLKGFLLSLTRNAFSLLGRAIPPGPGSRFPRDGADGSPSPWIQIPPK